MYILPVICLCFLTVLLLWMGKDSTWVRSKAQRNEKEHRKTELMSLMTRRKEENNRLMSFSKLSLVSY